MHYGPFSGAPDIRFICAAPSITPHDNQIILFPDGSFSDLAADVAVCDHYFYLDALFQRQFDSRCGDLLRLLHKAVLYGTAPEKLYHLFITGHDIEHRYGTAVHNGHPAGLIEGLPSGSGPVKREKDRGVTPRPLPVGFFYNQHIACGMSYDPGRHTPHEKLFYALSSACSDGYQIRFLFTRNLYQGISGVSFAYDRLKFDAKS